MAEPPTLPEDRAALEKRFEDLGAETQTLLSEAARLCAEADRRKSLVRPMDDESPGERQS